MARRTSTTDTTTQPAPKAPRTRKAQAPKVDAPSVTIPEDFAELTKALKSAKGVLWTMNDRRKKGATYEQATIDAQKAKVWALQTAHDAVKPARSNRKVYGPSWVVGIDATTGKVTTGQGEGEAVRNLAADLRGKGLVVSIVAKA
jgi:hypothetical protein